MRLTAPARSVLRWLAAKFSAARHAPSMAERQNRWLVFRKDKTF
jgi:hypothetical protein